MDTRRFRDRSEAIAAFRWLGWVMLMMFVLVQTVHASAAASPAQPDSTRPQSENLSKASVRFDPGSLAGNARCCAARTLDLQVTRAIQRYPASACWV
jgi:hypothetical protein